MPALAYTVARSDWANCGSSPVLCLSTSRRHRCCLGKRKWLDAVVWTALPGDFDRRVGQPFSIAAVIAYIKSFPVAGKVKAAGRHELGRGFGSLPTAGQDMGLT